MSDFKGALEYLDGRLKQCEQTNFESPEGPYLLVMTARVFHHQGRFKEALQLLEKAWKIRKSTQILYMIAYNKYMTGQYPEAIKALKILVSAAKTSKQFVEAKDLLVRCLNEYGD